MFRNTKAAPVHIIIALIIGAYALNWTWGVVSVNSRIINHVEQCRIAAQQYEDKTFFNLKVHFVAPLLPGVIIARYEYQVAGLWGWGGSELYFWWLGGCTPVYRFTEWIS